MKYYLVKLLTNTKGQDGSSIAVFNDKNGALVSYHQTLATYHNTDDVLTATVEILSENGDCITKEIVDHREQPTPATSAE